jgi:hypothetical protein
MLATKKPRQGVADLVLTPALWMLLGLAVIALACLTSTGAPFITLYFFRTQDLPAAIVIVVLFALVRRAAPRLTDDPRVVAAMDRLERLPVWAVVAGVLVTGLAGTWLVFGNYALSMDEFWAQADGQIFAAGHAMARIPLEWREYAPAMMPTFTRLWPGEGLWASAYLPVNAILQGLLGPLASPLLAAASVAIAADLARQLLPEHKSAPIICAVLMASSSQLLLTAMTPYAMTAHLAFNLAWLWLFLHRSRVAQAVAVAVALLAIGLHQLVFFPLFAAPFLVEAFLSGRRGASVLQGVAICAGGLLWSSYDAIVAWSLAATPAAGPTGTALMAERALAMLAGLGLTNLGLMSLNLIRAIVWQNVLVVPLVLAVAVPVVRTPGPWRPMLASVVLTVAGMTLLMAFQGHGWGYRYVHGLLGNLCLLATFGYFRLQDCEQGRRGLRAAFVAATAVSLALFPARAWLAARFAQPFREAEAAISRDDVDVVLVDAPHHVYTVDLVRNDPLLIDRPKRMTPFLLTDRQLDTICQRYRVAIFTDADASRFDIPLVGGGVDGKPLPPSCENQERRVAVS